MASLLDYYLSFVGAAPSNSSRSTEPDPSTSAMIKSDLEANSANPSSRQSIDSQGINRDNLGGAISNAMMGVADNLSSTTPIQIPRGNPIQPVRFQFPTISYQQQV